MIDCRYQCIGSCFAIDYSQEVPTVVNYLDTDYIRNCQAAITRYKELGYTTYSYEDSKVIYTSVRANFPYLTPDNCIAILSGELRIAAGSGNGFVSGISASSKHPEEALSLLALIAEDEEFRMQLFYGKEGRDYVLKDGYYVSVKQDDGSRYNLDFLSCLAYFSGLSCKEESMEFMRVPSVDNSAEPVIEGKTLLQTHQTLLDESVVWYPLQYAYSASAFDSGTLCFDFTGFEQELADMQEIYNYYFHFFTNHQEIKDNSATSEDESLPEMTQALTMMMGNVSVLNLLALIALGYCVVKIFFANIKRSGILMTQIAVGSLYMFSIPKGYTDGFLQWCKQVIALCVTAFLQMTLLYLGLLTWRNNMLLGLGVMLSANEVPRIAQTFGLDTSAKVNLSSAVYTTTSAVNLAKTIIKK